VAGPCVERKRRADAASEQHQELRDDLALRDLACVRACVCVRVCVCVTCVCDV
jgi:hypothetical protein